MRKLTENLIQQRVRTCTTDIDKVLQINITGRFLQDVSLLRKMTGVEILSLSFNNISTLADFQYCKNLKELYLRHNNITDLNEICYLKKLPNLRLLMLAENPCCEDRLYRPTVIRTLKNLVDLDGAHISLEERKEASKIGKEFGSNVESLNTHVLENYIPDGPQILRTPTSSNQKLKPAKSNPLKQLEEEPNGETELSARDSFDKIDGRKTPSKEAVNDRHHKQLPQRGVHNYKNKITSRKPADEYSRPDHPPYPNEPKNEPNPPYSNGTNQKMGPDRNESNSPFDATHQKTNLELHKRIVPKNSNLLSATLKLLKELDYPSLQVINAEVNSRIDTLETEYLYKAA